MADVPFNNNTAQKYGENTGQKKREFEAFFRLTYERLCSFAFGYVNSREEAEGIVQSTFLNVWEQKDLWDDFESAKAYMFKSVRNRALNYKKHERVKQESEPEIQLRMKEWKGYQDSDTLIARKVEVIRNGIRELPERRREIFKMSREHGLTYREIADALDISIKTVETQIGRSLKYLRSYVADHNFIMILVMLISI
ncbi:RNA polymerase sigma-70 factor, ECF subfamily [Fodinibius roseus]|uniref:RNA polymerase sigma-70 factor, ECF subfamily n=1 Tax=Fodinibius roseus TaxID=1194090 RepID=A0A1M4UN16_9BACT|nr:RNA polymerase sigma-70 factor [Fodinibius roseus]SHE58182.1 RNA polymerase sigma-70 factor, ECF subfamily [Fodinibius roseus]